MSTNFSTDRPWCSSRRALLQAGGWSAAGMLLGGGWAGRAWADAPPVKPAAKVKAKAVIQVWLWGGPSHLDTFDPKPEAGNDYCGPLNKPIETNVPGMRIGELHARAGQASG